MTPQRRLTIGIVVAGVSLAAAGIWFKWREQQTFFTPSVLLSRFPAEDAAVVDIDFAVLRQSGWLTASKTALEPEYKQFLDATGFDYRRDLDLAVASFSKSGNFYIARGRFHWDRLEDYARRQGGSCYQELCRMTGSTPERHISFLPLRADTIALAVSSDDLAATRLTKTGEPVTAKLPEGPVWFSAPGSLLRQPNVLPPAMRAAVSALAHADRLAIALAPDSTGVHANLEALCRSEDTAKVLASQLRLATSSVKDAIAQKKVAPDDSLAQLLALGTFDQTGAKVVGRWPLARSVIESLTAGI